MDRYDYACEGCQDLVSMTLPEYTRRVRQSRDAKGRNGKLLCDTCMHEAKLHRRRVLRQSTRSHNVGRDLTGVTVTAREQRTGNMRTLTCGGLAMEALRDVCARLDEADGDWRVLTISTPATIFVDLQGGRDVLNEMNRSPSLEGQLLGRIGRTDLLEARVRAWAVSA